VSQGLTWPIIHAPEGATATANTGWLLHDTHPEEHKQAPPWQCTVYYAFPMTGIIGLAHDSGIAAGRTEFSECMQKTAIFPDLA